MDRMMGVGDTVEDVMTELEHKYEKYELNKDLHRIMMDNVEGEAYDKTKGLQLTPGAEVYITIYRWFTEISGLGLAAQAYKAMGPEQANRNPT